MDREQRKAAIIRAALPLFAQHGFAATTTKQIARAAAISEPLLYKYFPSKDDLYREIQEFTCRATPFVNLAEIEASTSSLVLLYYSLMRALILGDPPGGIDWTTRHRLVLNSLLADGRYARLAYENRFEPFCAKLEACLAAAIKAGDVVRRAGSIKNRIIFAYQVGVWVPVGRLPATAVLHYDGSSGQVLEESVAFGLRGMGMTEQALAAHYKPKALALPFLKTS